jgi:hypothetical protein
MMDAHRLVLPTRETLIVGGFKKYRIACVCGWYSLADTFALCVAAFREHKRDASS